MNYGSLSASENGWEINQSNYFPMNAALETSVTTKPFHHMSQSTGSGIESPNINDFLAKLSIPSIESQLRDQLDKFWKLWTQEQERRSQLDDYFKNLIMSIVQQGLLQRYPTLAPGISPPSTSASEAIELNKPGPSQTMMPQPSVQPYRPQRVSYANRKIDILKERFEKKDSINCKERKELAKIVGLTERQIKVWFQNRRFKLRKEAREHGELMENN